MSFAQWNWILGWICGLHSWVGVRVLPKMTLKKAKEDPNGCPTHAHRMYVLISSAVYVTSSFLVEIFANAIEFLGTADCVEGEPLHGVLDEPILWKDGEYVVHETFVARPQRLTTATATCNKSPNQFHEDGALSDRFRRPAYI